MHRQTLARHRLQPVTASALLQSLWRRASLGPMANPVSSIPNLGPAAEQSYARAGIHTAEALRALGPDAAYAALLASGERPHFIGYYVLVMGLQGRPWNDCKGDEKAALRRRFDALKAAHAMAGGIAGIEAILDEIGVIDRRRAERGARRRG